MDVLPFAPRDDDGDEWTARACPTEGCADANGSEEAPSQWCLAVVLSWWAAQLAYRRVYERRIGSSVVIKGLASASQYNGQRGSVLRAKPAANVKHRVALKLDRTGKRLSVPVLNLVGLKEELVEEATAGLFLPIARVVRLHCDAAGINNLRLRAATGSFEGDEQMASNLLLGKDWG